MKWWRCKGKGYPTQIKLENANGLKPEWSGLVQYKYHDEEKESYICYSFMGVFPAYTYTYVQSPPLCDSFILPHHYKPRRWNHVFKSYKRYCKSRKTLYAPFRCRLRILCTYR